MMLRETIESWMEKGDKYFGAAEGKLPLEEIPLQEAGGRYLGEDAAEGKCLRGQRIGAQEIGILAEQGYGFVSVVCPPSVSLISVGNELVSIFEETGIGQCRDVNSYTFNLHLKSTGAKVCGISLIAAEESRLEKEIRLGLNKADLVLLIGRGQGSGSGCVEAVMESLCIEVSRFEFDGGAICFGIAPDENCCCHTRNRLVVWLQGEPKTVDKLYVKYVEAVIQRYYFGKRTGKEIAKTANTELTHINPQGRARMVNVGEKETTGRTAVAEACVQVNRDTLEIIKNGSGKKGDVLSTAQVAGIMAAKKTWDIIPMCHPIMISSADMDFSLIESETNDCGRIMITATVSSSGQTGVEMEALTAVSTAALTIYDMCKAVQRDIVVSDIHLTSKSGGKSGDFRFMNSDIAHGAE